MVRAMTRLTLLGLLATGCATTGAATTAFYPLEELRALDTPEDHGELLARAPEVAPSRRTDEWRALVARAAVATLVAAEVKDEQTAERALALTESLPARFPSLSKSPAFLAGRADLGVRALGWASRRDTRQWTERVVEFARRDAVTPGLAQRLADEVLLKQLVPSTAFGLFELALARDGAAACASPTLAKVVLDVGAYGGQFPAALDTCWAQLEGPLTAAAKSAETHTAKLKLCALMASRAGEASVKAACAD